ncbi:MAG TPA: lysophospholipid acyltransferase family protein [Candidatus Sulfotelmatobacter sp.]|nr:lysophospholipid acyltransferase family protein [Candidatus Sulfotelmatobacter sp.]
MMRLWKRLIRSAAAQRLACWLIQLYIRLVHLTGSWREEHGEIARRLVAARQPFIGAFWHGRMLMIPVAWNRRAPLAMLISGHRDGRLIAGAVAHFGIGWVMGSSSGGGGAALRRMVKHIRGGAYVAITPDGPRGPAMRASAGIVTAARLAEVPIVPITYATRRRRLLRTWDRFHLPLPFGAGVFVWGEPVTVAVDADDGAQEDARALLEARLNAITAEADRLMGHAATVPEPAPAGAPAGVALGSGRK